MNSPIQSKINWSALVLLGVGIALKAGYLPAEYEAEITEAAYILMPALIIVFRTWFTDKPSA